MFLLSVGRWNKFLRAIHSSPVPVFSIFLPFFSLMEKNVSPDTKSVVSPRSANLQRLRKGDVPQTVGGPGWGQSGHFWCIQLVHAARLHLGRLVRDPESLSEWWWNCIVGNVVSLQSPNNAEVLSYCTLIFKGSESTANLVQEVYSIYPVLIDMHAHHFSV